MQETSDNYLGAASLAVIPFLLAAIVLAYITTQSPDPTPLPTATAVPPSEVALASGMNIYIEYCLVCHAADGQGTAQIAVPPLNDPTIRNGDTEYLESTINLGHEGTAMVGFGEETTGRLTDEEISNVIAFVQYGDWLQVAANIPPTPTPAPTTIASSSSSRRGQEERVYDPAVIEMGIEVYMDICLACHGPDMRGNGDVADLSAREVQRKSDAALLEIIRLGVDGTEMTGYRAMLTPEQIDAVLALIRSPEVLAP